ncbi:MAG: hypothetical protein ROD09_15300 [Candidatus Sedimenticola sp. (ex Thyasira tokunagai)]
MEKMQAYIDFIFFQVWCKARDGDYAVDTLFSDQAELQALITELHTSEVKGADFFLTGLQQVFEDFKLLTDAQIDQLKRWYRSNNNIESVCSCGDDVEPAVYGDVSTISDDLSKHLRGFFKNLYSHSFLSLKSVREMIGNIDDHYHQFMTTNSKGKCPFCGIHDIKGIYHSNRDAYDHYLPKDKYPFNTINFRNLAPACPECNSSYKLTTNPVFECKTPITSGDGAKRKAFYPYCKTEYHLELNIKLDMNNGAKITPDDIVLSVGPEEHGEQIATWMDVYGIDERYKAKCSGENDGRYWIEQVIDECQNDGKTPEEIFTTLTRQARLRPFAETNFLKRPFLEACDRAGLFDKSLLCKEE